MKLYQVQVCFGVTVYVKGLQVAVHRYEGMPTGIECRKAHAPVKACKCRRACYYYTATFTLQWESYVHQEMTVYPSGTTPVMTVLQSSCKPCRVDSRLLRNIQAGKRHDIRGVFCAVVQLSHLQSSVCLLLIDLKCNIACVQRA